MKRDADDAGARQAKASLASGSGSEAASAPPVRDTPVTRKEFSTAFDRCFARVYAYVGRHVSDGAACERIVSQVLEANLDLLVERGDERQEVSRLKAASDRLIESERLSA